MKSYRTLLVLLFLCSRLFGQENPEAFLQKEIVLDKQGQFDAGIDVGRLITGSGQLKAVELGRAYLALGVAYQGEGKPAEAQGEFDQCLRILKTEPNNVSDYVAAADSIPAFRVHVVNLTEATPATITRAENEAGWILHNAGLNVVWLNCSREQAAVNPSDPCQQPLSPANVFVRVLSDQTRKGFQDSVFGFAVFPVLASAYYGSAIDLARAFRAEGMDVPTILGGVMAHEIGHLLLGLDSHSPTGIMQAHWGRKQVRELLKRDLLFTGEQSRQIRASGRVR